MLTVSCFLLSRRSGVRAVNPSVILLVSAEMARALPAAFGNTPTTSNLTEKCSSDHSCLEFGHFLNDFSLFFIKNN